MESFDFSGSMSVDVREACWESHWLPG